MNHGTIPESTRTMLQDLENIEKVYVECANNKARANKAKASTAPKSGGQVPRKHVREGGSKGPAPKKVHSAKYCKWCKAAGGPFTTHETAECHRFNKECKQLVKPTKPFDSAKSPERKAAQILARWLICPRKWRSSKASLKGLRSTARSVLVTCRKAIPTVTRIVGTVVRAFT
jgi:hypothetical protein